MSRRYPPILESGRGPSSVHWENDGDWVEKERHLRDRGFLSPLAVLVVGLSVVLGVCGCGGSRSLKIVSDFPLQNAKGDRPAEPNVKAIESVMEKAGGACNAKPEDSLTGIRCTGAKAGEYTIEYESYDDATAAADRLERGHLRRERPNLREGRFDRRGHRPPRLRLRRDRDPDPERGPARDDQPEHHLQGPHQEWAG